MMMRLRFRQIFLLFLLGLIAAVAAGCGSPGWEAKLDAPPAYKSDAKLPLKLTVTDKGQPVTGLTVTATLEMTRMAHDQVNVAFTEKGGGVYQADAALPMDGEWTADITMKKDGSSKEASANFQTKAEASAPVAAVGDQIITLDDLNFYALANEVQSLLDKTSTPPQDKNSLLTQAIRLQAVGQLAREKGLKAAPDKIAAELAKTRTTCEADADLNGKIGKFGAAQFWQDEQNRLTLLELALQVQNQVRDKTKADQPQAASKEIDFQTAQSYEDLVVSQISSLHVRLM